MSSRWRTLARSQSFAGIRMRRVEGCRKLQLVGVKSPESAPQFGMPFVAYQATVTSSGKNVQLSYLV